MTVAQKPKLKWHRFLQIIGLPAAILYYGYRLISLFAELAGLNLSWTENFLSQWLAMAGTDVFHLGPYFWPVVGVIAGSILLFVLAVLAWTGSLRWRSYSWKCWIAFLLVQMAASFAGLWIIWEYGLNRGGLINFVQYYYMRTGKEIQVTSAMITGIRVFLVLTAILILLYFIMNLIYYLKRRSLYSYGDRIQLPYEEEDEEETEEMPQAAEKASAEPETPDAPVFAEVKEEPAPEQTNDELDRLLKDTENSFAALNPVYEEPADSALSGETEEIRLSLDPEEEEPAPAVTRAMPVLTEEETKAAEEIPAEPAVIVEENIPEPEEEKEEVLLSEAEAEPAPVYETPAADHEESAPFKEEPSDPAVKFCPDCGTRIPDPEMKFCIHCGRRIR